MNDVYTVPVALVRNTATAPRARQWHALDDGLTAVVVVDFADDGARREFEAQAGVMRWPDPYRLQPMPEGAVPAGLTKAVSQQAADMAPDVLERLRATWPMARYHFD